MAASAIHLNMEAGYDTDTISVTSTVESEWSEDSKYLVENIIAERVEENGDKSYLIRWDGYGMHRCTWEPTAHVSEGTLLQDWEESKDALNRGQVPGFNSFIEFNERNIEAFETAFLDAEEAKFKRKEKRAKKRKRVQIVDLTLDDSYSDDEPMDMNDDEPMDTSEDDMPLITRSREEKSKAIQALQDKTVSGTPTRSDQAQSAVQTVQNKPVFETPTRDNQHESRVQTLREKAAPRPETPLFVRETSLESIAQRSLTTPTESHGPEKAPWLQDVGTTKDRVTKEPLLGVKENQPRERRDDRVTVLSPRSPVQEQCGEPPRAQPTKRVEVAKVPQKGPKEAETRPSEKTADGPIKNKTREESVTIQHEVSKSSTTALSAAPSVKVSTQPSKKPKLTATTLSVVPPALKKTSETMIKRSGTSGIRIINQEPTRKRKEWQNGSTPFFKKVKYRRKAELRQRDEKAPDISVLQFVNASPSSGLKSANMSPTTPQTAGRPTSIWGLRDDTRQSRRNTEREESTDQILSPREPEPEPQPEWEKNKIPLTCFEWKNGSCRHAAEKCIFLHRITQHTAPADGTVPGKFKRPKLMCFFWFTDARGCRKTADECTFAHELTGWLASIEHGFKEGIKVDPNVEPRFLQEQARQEQARQEQANQEQANQEQARRAAKSAPVPSGYMPPKRETTCYFYLNGVRGCNKPADWCAFAHKNTGWLANPGEHQPKRIDPSLTPIYSTPRKGYTERPGNSPLQRRRESLPDNQKQTREESVADLNQDAAKAYPWADRTEGPSEGHVDRQPESPSEPRRETFIHPDREALMQEPEDFFIEEQQQPPEERLGVPPGGPPRGPKEVSSRRESLAETQTEGLANHTKEAISERPRSTSHRKTLTCFFYNMGKCTNTEDTCLYAHSMTGKVANPPPTFVPPPRSIRASAYKGRTGYDSYMPQYESPICRSPISYQSYHNDDMPSAASPSPASHPPRPIVSAPVANKQLSSPPMPAISTSLSLPHTGGYVDAKVLLSGLEEQTSGIVQAVLRGRQGLKATHAVYSTGWKLWAWQMHKGSDKREPIVGYVLPDPTVPVAVQQLENTRQYLEHSVLGCVILDKEFTIVIYPARSELWAFLDSKSLETHPSAKLRFHLLPKPLQVGDPRMDGALATPLMDLSTIIGRALKLDIGQLFNHHGRIPLQRKAFLLYHPVEHKAELDLVTAFLLMHNVEVFPSWMAGAWDCFRQDMVQGGPGVILAHKDFRAYHLTPNFGKVLKQQVKIYEVGCHEAKSLSSKTTKSSMTYDCVPVFQAGGVIFITDDVFRDRPVQALKLVRSFLKKVERIKQTHDILVWRLGTRPGLLDFLESLCYPHLEAIKAFHPEHRCRLELFQTLYHHTFPQKPTTVDRMEREDHWPVISPPAELMAEYYNCLEESQRKADDWMMNFYAGWVIEQKTRYRQLSVVHTAPGDVSRWVDQYNHIGDILTPEELNECFENGKLDFLEAL